MDIREGQVGANVSRGGYHGMSKRWNSETLPLVGGFEDAFTGRAT